MSIFSDDAMGDNSPMTVPLVRLPHIVGSPATPACPEPRWRLWLRRLRTRRQLARLAAERLCDVGLTPAERDAECARWFWEP
jgi:uncharacterized protein YjiS (DUF1127 family)